MLADFFVDISVDVVAGNLAYDPFQDKAAGDGMVGQLGTVGDDGLGQEA